MGTGPVILIIGTRPEGIKMAPVYHALKKAGIPVIVICTMQHDQLLTDVLELFCITPDYTLDIMRLGQDLFYLTQAVLQKTKKLFTELNPALVLVQGDTTSSMAAALAAFYLHIPVGHVEAGLRTDDIYAPFPEEMNRRVISVIAQYHFAPTQASVANAVAHGVRRDQIFCTGNTVVDALHHIQYILQEQPDRIHSAIRTLIEQWRSEHKKIVLLTMHRRESFHGGIKQVLDTIKQIALEHPDICFLYPYHPNPQVIQAIADAGITNITNISITGPISYINMVYLLLAADLILTDSGGIQEEAISLLKPVLVLREKTERMEGVLVGLAHIVGTNPHLIQRHVLQILYSTPTVPHAAAKHTYGNGDAADIIVSIIQQILTRTAAHQTTPQMYIQQPQEKALLKGNTMKKVAVIGLGYIGLPTAITIAEQGLSVIGIDINQDRVNRINSGDPDLHEPDLYEKLQLILAHNFFHAQTSVEPADYFIIAVPTPLTKDKKADLHHVFDAAASIAPVLQKGNVVILESTVSVGTTERLTHYLAEESGMIAGKDFFVAHSPERVLPGKIFYELEHNDRVIGGINQELYQYFVRGSLFLTDTATAEMVKLIENSARDVEIAFAHQVASMAYAHGINPYHVIELANKHPRVNILSPTCGVGGHCLAVDPWFLIESFPAHSTLIAAARMVNEEKPVEVTQRINAAVNAWQQQHPGRCSVAFFGLTYKPNVDDLRESPACAIVQQYTNRSDLSVMICEPYVKTHKMPLFAKPYITTVTQATTQADILVLLVAHDQFKVINFATLTDKKIVDCCGLTHHTHSTHHQFIPAIKIDEFIEAPFITDEMHIHKKDTL